jgi:hypothetical protein
MGDKVTKFDGKAAITGFTAIVKAHNNSCERYWEKLRGNPLKVAKRLIYDWRNAFNSARYRKPWLEEDEMGRKWLRTAPSLIVAGEENSLCARTAKRCLDRLATMGGLVLELKEEGNDVLVRLDPAYLHFYEQDTAPKKPPEAEASGRHMDAHGLSEHDLARLQRFNLKWHISEL